MHYRIPDSLPWDQFAGPWEHATDRLARLDQRLRDSDLRTAWIGRAHFEEASASAWLDGDLVTLEELVLYDANAAPALGGSAVFRAHTVLVSRRALAGQSANEILTVDNIVALQTRRDTVDAAFGANPFVAYDPNWDTAGRVAAWLDVLPTLATLPALPAAALALDAWHALEPVEHGNAALGRLLIPAYLQRRGPLAMPALCLGAGLRALRRPPALQHPIGRAIAGFCDAVAAADHGLALHARLVLARQRLDRHLNGRRRSSRLPALLALVLEHPLVSAALIAQRLKMSPQRATGYLTLLARTGVLRELSGRGRFRIYGLA